MYVVIITSFIALILTCFDSKNLTRNGMFWGFVMLTTLGVIHYDYGNDYMAYYHLYNEITKYPLTFDSLTTNELFRDPGWVVLCHLFSYFGGFFTMVAVLNIIQNVLVYRFIKSNIERTWWPMAIFIYMCNTGLYLMNFSMMRQGLVVCLFLGIWDLIKNRKWWWALLIMYLCSFIHLSAIILLPFAFWGYLPKLNGKVWAIVYGVLLIFLWTSGETLNNIFMSGLSLEEFQEYAATYEDIGTVGPTGIGFIINLLPFLVALYYLLTDKTYKDKQNIVLLSLLSFIIAPFAQIIPMVGRIGIYFTIYNIAAIPIIYRSIKKIELRYGLLSVFIIITLYDYWLFFNQGVYVRGYYTFHTIFESM